MCTSSPQTKIKDYTAVYNKQMSAFHFLSEDHVFFCANKMQLICNHSLHGLSVLQYYFPPLFLFQEETGFHIYLY